MILRKSRQMLSLLGCVLIEGATGKIKVLRLFLLFFSMSSLFLSLIAYSWHLCDTTTQYDQFSSNLYIFFAFACIILVYFDLVRNGLQIEWTILRLNEIVMKRE